MARVIDFLGDLATDVVDGSDIGGQSARPVYHGSKPSQPVQSGTTISYVITGAAGGQIDRTTD